MKQNTIAWKLNNKVYPVCEKLAYSKIGKMIATKIRNKFYPLERVHWVQQRMAEWRF